MRESEMCKSDPVFCKGGTKGKKIYICIEEAQNQNCGYDDLVELLIHEYAHMAGMPGETHWPPNTNPDIPARTVPPEPWLSSGVSGTHTDGVYTCKGH
jgi:hypothetical protein